MDLREYTESANGKLRHMGESPASEEEMRRFFEAGIPSDDAAEDVYYSRCGH